MTQSILVIDDEADIRDILSDIFQDEGYIVHKAAHSEQALSIINSNKIDMIVLDIWLDNSDMDGVQILKHLKKSNDHKSIPILMISGHGNVEMAVNAMKIGAFDFIEKPFKIDHILLTASRALEQKSLKEENTRLKELDGDIGVINNQYKSPSMAVLMKSIQDNAESDARILISGQKGTGKTYVAKMIHDVSKRSKNGVAVFNCDEFIPEDVLNYADKHPNATIILENIETLSLDNQTALMKTLHNNDLKCRLITTCDPKIKTLIEKQEFSSTLYDRLSVIKYDIPSLYDRIDDIGILVHDFSQVIAREFHITPPEFSTKLIRSLEKYNWQGNIRQLKIAIEWLMMVHMTNPEQELSLDNMFGSNVVPYEQNTETQAAGNHIYDMPLKQARDQFEKDYLEKMLSKFDGNIAKVAEYIDMERTALYRKLKLMNITYGEETTAKAN